MIIENRKERGAVVLAAAASIFFLSFGIQVGISHTLKSYSVKNFFFKIFCTYELNISKNERN